ncbi:hypothetical protein N7472_006719 [Penicillium cf. griseofulvum]|uniref:Uncharacterized protein n=1 Tax=Penicillium cf. griseofulvum TaxID=2972120 RepID=A0A9W9JCI0_9EURO|nr:hypothetical protein N7472_006719 [Penicillium cf. griseofulvum]KAJ5447227.1 hypothetical protein N7445_002048 [Penicillium cf. griseofulvum]
MLLRYPFVTILALVAAPTGVLSRKGDGSSSGSGSGSDSDTNTNNSDSNDSNDNDDTSSSTTTSSELNCIDTHRLDFDDLQPSHYDKYNREPRRGHASAYSDLDGVFFKGEASLKYTIITPPTNLTEGDIVSSSLITCPVGRQSIRMLGAAWVAAKAPAPAGPVNPITLGFKAWESNIRVSDIDNSYSVCDNLDLVRLTTTVDLLAGNGVQAMDAVALDITQAADNSNKVLFDGSYDLKDWTDSERDSTQQARYADAGLYDQMIALPDSLCSEKSKLGKLLIGWPTGTHINGSMTNETLELNFSGATVAGFGHSYGNWPDTDTKVNVTFELTFTGSLDTANSSQVLLTGASSHNASLISFERATSSATDASLSLYCIFLSFLVSFGVMVL